MKTLRNHFLGKVMPPGNFFEVEKLCDTLGYNNVVIMALGPIFYQVIEDLQTFGE